MAGSEHDDEKTRRARRPRQPELSPEGRVIVRSSSHPPDRTSSLPPVTFGAAVDASGVHEHPALRGPRPERGDEKSDRFKRSTPAERPRKRKSLRSVQVNDVRLHRPTPRAYPRGRIPLTAPALPLQAVAVAKADRAEHEEVTRRSLLPAQPPAAEVRPSSSARISLPVALLLMALLMLSCWWLFG